MAEFQAARGVVAVQTPGILEQVKAFFGTQPMSRRRLVRTLGRLLPGESCPPFSMIGAGNLSSSGSNLTSAQPSRPLASVSGEAIALTAGNLCVFATTTLRKSVVLLTTARASSGAKRGWPDRLCLRHSLLLSDLTNCSEDIEILPSD